MRTILYKSTAIRVAVLILFAALIISVWPLRVWQTSVTASGGGTREALSDPVNGERDVLQRFIAQYDRIGSIDVYIEEFTGGRYIYFMLFDKDYQRIYTRFVDCGETELPGYVRIPMNVPLEVGEVYTAFLIGCLSSYTVGYETIPEDASPYVLELAYHDTGMPGWHLDARYNYSVPLSKRSSLLIMAGLFLTAAALYALIGWYYRKREERNGLLTARRAVRTILNPVAGILFAVLLCMVLPLRLFDDRTPDVRFYSLGIVIAAFFVFYAINFAGKEPEKRRPAGERIREYAQMAAIALAIYYGCSYMNALYDIFHAIAERQMAVCLLAMLLLTFSGKEVLRPGTALYLLAAVPCGIVYRRLHLLAETEKEYDLHNTVTDLDAAVAVLGGLVILHVARGWYTELRRNVREKGKCRLSPFGILTVLLLAALILFRNTRMWGIALAVFYGLFYLRFPLWEGRKQWLRILSGGLALNFVCSMGYCLLFRYFIGFTTARFSFVFHTVTVTAEYLTFMECAAAVLLLGKLRTCREGAPLRQVFAEVWKEFVLFGCTTAYTIFTMSRTAYLAAAFSVLLLLLITCRGMGRTWARGFLKAAAAMALSAAVLFPAVFTLQRILPAMVARPFIFEIESVDPDLRGGAAWDNRNFMCVERFAGVFAEKILGMGTIHYTWPEDRNNYDAEGNPLYDLNGNPLKAASSVWLTAARGTGEAVTTEAEGTDEAAETEEDRTAEDTEEEREATEDIAEEEAAQEEASGLDEFSNGRITIFKSYVERLNLTGHDEMGVSLPDGELAVHAHNTYLQVAFDHGVPTGILFAVWLLTALFAGYRYNRRNGAQETAAALPVAVTIGFAVAAVSEWVFQFSNPMTAALMLALAPLLYRFGEDAPLREAAKQPEPQEA